MDLKSYSASQGFKKIYNLPNKEGSLFLKKVGGDLELSDDEKKSFFEYLKKYKAGDIKAYCTDYFKNGKKFISKNDYNGDKNIPFIRIKDVQRFAGWIKEIVTEDVSSTIETLLDNRIPNDIREIAFNALLATEIREEITNNPDKAQFYLGLVALPSSTQPFLLEAKTDPWMVWSFPLPDDEDDLFSTRKLNTLDCRAGLSGNKDLEKVVYKHNIKSCKTIKKPTTFDAEFYTQFELGGKTKPLEECKKEQGFDEFVHEPNHFKDVIELPHIIIK